VLVNSAVRKALKAAFQNADRNLGSLSEIIAFGTSQSTKPLRNVFAQSSAE